MNYRISSLALFSIAVLTIVLLPTAADAITITPTRFEVRGNPGEILDEKITLINEDDVKSEILYPSYSNFEAQGESGSPSFTDPTDDLGTWISTDESISLKAREQKTIHFKVAIPKDAEPGGHFAVIFFGTSPTNGKGGLSIGAKTGILVLLSVNGDVKEQAGLLSFNTINKQFWYNTLPVSLEYRFRNDGGDRIKPQGTIKIRDTVFLPADKIDANPGEGNVLPNSTRKITVDWVKYERPNNYTLPSGGFGKFWDKVTYQWKNFAVGLYSAKLDVSYGVQATHVKKTLFFFVFPWQLVLVILLVLFIVFWGGKKLIKRYNRIIIERARVGMQKENFIPSSSSNG